MRLRLVHEGSFNKSEVTLFAEAMAANAGLVLTANECVLLISKGKKVLQFVWPQRTMKMVNGRGIEQEVTVVGSRRHRIIGGGLWNPLMLSDYAEEVGIELEGLRKFEAYYNRLKTA